MPFQALKTQRLPMLHTKLGRFDKDWLFDVAINYLENLMKLEDIETEFVARFFQGDFRPELLFDEPTSNSWLKIRGRKNWQKTGQ